MTYTKDSRTSYNNQVIECNGNTVHFDGKGDKETGVLKVYRYYGDITIQAEALQDFAIVNGYSTVKI